MHNKVMIRIGYHVSIAGGIDRSFGRANEVGCTAMQIFISSPRVWNVEEPTKEAVENFKQKSNSLDIKPVFVHMPYLPNLSSSNKEVYKRSIFTLERNISLCGKLGIRYLVAHMGSHMGHGKETGLNNVVNAINGIDSVPKGFTLLLENTAGQRNSVGSEIGELARIYDEVENKNVGFCLDTCHLFAAGYDITQHDVLDRINETLGFSKVHAFHINDSKYELGSHRDRHDNIGFGHIGRRGFKGFFEYKDISEKPLILETPYREELGESEELKIIKGIINSSYG